MSCQLSSAAQVSPAALRCFEFFWAALGCSRLLWAALSCFGAAPGGSGSVSSSLFGSVHAWYLSRNTATKLVEKVPGRLLCDDVVFRMKPHPSSST